MNSIIKKLCFIAILLLNLLSGKAQENDSLFRVDSLFDYSKPATLGLKFASGVETYTIFKPDSNQNHYNHGVVLYPFKDELYAQWQSSLIDEDSEDTQVFYSKSTDGKIWSKPIALGSKLSNGICTSGGWWSNGDTLIAYICVWPNKLKPKGGHTEYMSSTDGINWSERKAVTTVNGVPVLGIIEQDVHALPSGRIITAFHMQPGLIISPFYTDDKSGIRAWKKADIELLSSNKTEISREIEPSWFYRQDSAVIMVFRDQNSSFKKLASISYNNGQSWSKPILINTPDSRAKQSAGNLPDGTAFMVNNPSGNKSRIPLAITLSRNGFVFDKAYLIRSGNKDLQSMRKQGKYKRIGYSYPKSIVWNNYLYIGYATNKEDIELSRIPLNSLKY